MGRKPKRARTPAARRRRSPMRAATVRGSSQRPLNSARCEQFLLHEARLLDDGRFDEWLALFTTEVWYGVRRDRVRPDLFEPVPLISDARGLPEPRGRPLATPRLYSQGPGPRTSRIIANVTIEEAGRGACTVRSKFMMIEYRREQQRI